MSKSLSPARRALGACLAPVIALSMAPAMTACGGGAATVPPPTPPAIRAEARADTHAPDAVWVKLELEAPEQHWSLLGNDEKVLCELPCARWLSPGGGAFLQFDQPGKISMLRVPLPTDLGPPGGTVVVVARPKYGSERLGTQLILGGVSLGILGLILFVALDNLGGDTSALAVSVALGLGAPFLGAGIFLRVKSHPPDAVKSASAPTPAPRATFALGPGYLEAASPSPEGFHVIVTPLGAAGTF
jgi:hypothetical protein